MNQASTTAADTTERGARTSGLDAQLAELIETVWACEQAARREDRIDAVVRVAALRSR